MAKKMKTKKKGLESAVLSLVEPCGESCGVHKGILCPECGEFGELQRNSSESVEDTDEETELSAR